MVEVSRIKLELTLIISIDININHKTGTINIHLQSVPYTIVEADVRYKTMAKPNPTLR